jgi:hypothetical protein
MFYIRFYFIKKYLQAFLFHFSSGKNLIPSVFYLNISPETGFL